MYIEERSLLSEIDHEMWFEAWMYSGLVTFTSDEFAQASSFLKSVSLRPPAFSPQSILQLASDEVAVQERSASSRWDLPDFTWLRF